MIFDILEQKLIDAGVAEAGKSLFRGYMPSDVTVGVMLRTPLDGIKIDPFIEGWHKTELQVIVRHTDPVEGLKLANRVSQVLYTHKLEKYPANEERGPAHINAFYPETLPVQYPRLEGNAIEFSQYFKAAFGFQPNWRPET